MQTSRQRILEKVQEVWGYRDLRPLQLEAIEASLHHRDSLVVLPTGGGKSLCYQVPPLLTGRLAVVISPLISLMKDQVDGLRLSGYPAGAIHSALSPQERRRIVDDARLGSLRLLFVSPERVQTEWFQSLAKDLDVQSFSIDEAHCISHWGHDFRKDYRRLRSLKETFPEAAVHAFTATATPRVRQDIVELLRLRDPAELVGVFDRPNLTYRILPKMGSRQQVEKIVRRHGGEGALVYCLSRVETETLAAYLLSCGIDARPYHAGLPAGKRAAAQEAFSREKAQVVVATVAFGMGIDRSNVRCVVHASLPRSVEQYQQETGRAGRDGLPAECVLLYSYSDAIRWERLLKHSFEGGGAALQAALTLLKDMTAFCSAVECRHRRLSRYFGQQYPKDDCGACDVCLDEVEILSDSTAAAQKILSCVYHLRQGFGVGYAADVLRGADTARIRRFGHRRLTTFGILSEHPKKLIENLIYQLVDQSLLRREGAERPVLKLTPDSAEVLKGIRNVKLKDPSAGRPTAARGAAEEIPPSRMDLYQSLRELRLKIAAQEDVPAYVVFSDATLRDLVFKAPRTEAGLSGVYGIGEHRIQRFGKRLLEEIARHCGEIRDDGEFQLPGPEPELPFRRQPKPARGASARESPKSRAQSLLARGEKIEAVARATNRTVRTVEAYLAEMVEQGRIEHPGPWVDAQTYDLIAEAAKETGMDRLKPIYERLDSRIDYLPIRLVTAHLKRLRAESEGSPAPALPT